jgi:5'-3' exonuclease
MNAQQSENDATLLLIDGTAIIRRVYEANAKKNPNHSGERLADHAFSSALSSFRIGMEEVGHFTHALAPFDHQGKNWRHRQFPPYKEGRKPMSPELRERIPEFRAALKSQLGLHSIEHPGVESDDVIGTCTRRWFETTKGKGKVKIIAHDKDMLWLMAHGAMIYHYFDHVWRDRAYVQERFFGIEPGQVLDYLALMGDKTDNVPGIDLCGQKTAAAWLIEYGNLEGVIANRDKIPGAVGKNLRANIELLRLARRLVSLASNVPLGLTWKELRMVQTQLKQAA